MTDLRDRAQQLVSLLKDQAAYRRFEEALGSSYMIMTTTGYSKVPSDDLSGLTEEHYQNSAEILVTAIVQKVIEDHPGIRIGVIHGSNPLGFDRVVQKVFRQFGLPQLGVYYPGWGELPSNCPFEILQVDEEQDFYLALASLGDISLQFGGRKGAVEVSAMAACFSQKPTIVVPPHFLFFGETPALSSLLAKHDPTLSFATRLRKIAPVGYNEMDSTIEQTLQFLAVHFRALLPGNCALSLQTSFGTIDHNDRPGLTELIIDDDSLFFQQPSEFVIGEPYCYRTLSSSTPHTVLGWWENWELDQDGWLPSGATVVDSLPKDGEPNGRHVRIEKHFYKARIISEEQAANIYDFMLRPDVIGFGAVGYSSMNRARTGHTGLTTQEYEQGVAAYLTEVLSKFQAMFPQVELVVVDGASSSGVDKGSSIAAISLQSTGGNYDYLSTSCLEYLRYVDDEPGKLVILSETDSQYAESFGRLTKANASLGGGYHTLWLDIFLATQDADKPVILLDLIELLSSNGVSLPVFMGDGSLANATELFNRQVKVVRPTPGHDLFESVIQNTVGCFLDALRRLLLKRI